MHNQIIITIPKDKRKTACISYPAGLDDKFVLEKLKDAMEAVENRHATDI